MINPKQEKTVFIIKPDGVKRGLVGEILSRFEKRGLKIIALNMVSASKEEIDNHYPKDEVWIKRLGEKSLANYQQYGVDPKEKLGTDDPFEIGKMLRKWVVEYMTSGPVVKGVISGVHAIDMVRKICGNTLPNLADMGTIRGDFSVDSAVSANLNKRSIRNIIHASENEREFKNEVELWFKEKEIHDYKRAEEDIMF